MNTMVTYSFSECTWIFAVPLYHLLTGAVKPFSRTSVHSSASHRKPQWWGIADIGNLVDIFKKSKRQDM